MVTATSDFDFDLTVNGIVERIAYQLGDAEPGEEYDSYDKNWIKARVYDTFKWLQGRRPNLFANEKTFDLEYSGQSNYSVPDDCESLLEILNIVIDGKLTPVNDSDYQALRNIQVYEKLLPNCVNDVCSYHAAVSEVNSRVFHLSPPPPPGRSVQVIASCSDMGRFFDDCDKEINCEIAKWINMVVEYVLWQALSMDSENPTSAAAVDRHRETFFELAPVRRRQEGSTQ